MFMLSKASFQASLAASAAATCSFTFFSAAAMANYRLHQHTRQMAS